MCKCGTYYCADDNQHYANCDFECEYYTTPSTQTSTLTNVDDEDDDELPF